MPSASRIRHLLLHPAELRERLFSRYEINRHARQYGPWQRRAAGQLRRFHNIHEGERCFIIGNGPSLNRMDLSLLNGHVCFGLNKIHLLFDRTGLEIDYHVAVNRLVIGQAWRAFRDLGVPSFLSLLGAHGQVKPFENRYLLYSVPQFTFCEDITRGIFEGCTVTYVAMQIAFYMGFREVFLVGVDHNFRASGNPNEKQLMEGPDEDHFDPDYFRGMHWQLPDLEGSEMAYRLAQYFYRRSGREIYDATIGGKLQVFPKISYEEALECCRAGR